MEPGAAVQWALNVTHPFSIPAHLDPYLETAVRQLALSPETIVAQRVAALAFWEAEAHRLMPLTLQRIAAQPDAALRTLLLGGDAEAAPVLGRVCHVALYEATLNAMWLS